MRTRLPIRSAAAWLILGCVLLFPCIGADGASLQASSPKPQSIPFYRNTTLGADYVGSQACARCHADIYQSYSQTDMGRSMARAFDPATATQGSKPVTIPSKLPHRYYQVFRRDSEVYESEYELDAAGRTVFKEVHKLDYAMGSGIAGITYLVQRGSYFFEAPLSYYFRSRSWDLSPGYQFQDYGFDRPVLAQCIVCHSGRPNPSEILRKHAAPFNSDVFEAAQPAFHELEIGCENCHGPGQLHVQERLKATSFKGADTSIVNPARLPVWLANNICMECHQGGDARVLKPGKTVYDFRPGRPLDDTLAIFQLPLRPDSPTPSPQLGYYYGMILSKCYTASNGKLGCLTCHDPHRELTGPSKVAWFRARCLTCHTEKSCALPRTERLRRSPFDDCASCHMPKRDLSVISHSALTDHRIVARSGEPYPATAFEPASESDLFHINAIPGQSDSLPAVVLLEAYAQVAQSSPVYRDRYNQLLDQVEKQDPDNLFVLSALAQRALFQHGPGARGEAIRYLSQAIELGSTYPADYLRLGILLREQQRVPEAVNVLQQGMRLAPYNTLFAQMLASCYVSSKQYDEAISVIKKALEQSPQDDSLRRLVKSLEDQAAQSR